MPTVTQKIRKKAADPELRPAAGTTGKKEPAEDESSTGSTIFQVFRTAD